MSAFQPVIGGRSYRDFFSGQDFRKTEGMPGWFSEIQEESYRHFRAVGFPEIRMENWKHVDLPSFLEPPFSLTAQDSSWAREAENLGKIFCDKKEGGRFVFLNGAEVASCFLGKDIPPGVLLTNLSGAIREMPEKVRPFLASNSCRNQDRSGFEAVNTFSFKEGVFLLVPAGVKADLPVRLFFAGFGAPDMPLVFYPRILVVLEEGAEATVVCRDLSLNQEKFLANAVVEICLAESAKLEWIHIRQGDEKSFHLSKTYGQLSRRSRLHTVSFTQGGARAYHETEVNFKGDEAACSLEALMLLSGETRVSDRIVVNHRFSQCVSRQLCKSIVSHHAQAEYDSLVHVFENTKGSDSDQLNRNLILSEWAKTCSRPQLKIDSDDVRATHGSATGQLDEEELFYLRSRGLSLRDARFMLVEGFAGEVLERIKSPKIKEELEDFTRHWLKKRVH